MNFGIRGEEQKGKVKYRGAVPPSWKIFKKFYAVCAKFSLG